MRIFRNKRTRKIVQLNDEDEKINKMVGNPEWKELIEI